MGKTENDLLKLPFKGAYMFRPGGILPLHGVKSKTKVYQAVYTIMKPFYPLLEKGFPPFCYDFGKNREQRN